MNLHFGFDIGIASAAWAVVDRDTLEVIELGSNTFESADASKNVDRRSKRQLRRMHRRHFTRMQDFLKLWKGYKDVPNLSCNNPLELRVKGLSEALTETELYWVMYNLLQHRGISYLDDALDEAIAGQSDYQKGIAINELALKEKFPCEIQLERYNKFGAYRGNITVVENEEKITYSNAFTKSAYRKEIEQILSTQKKYHEFLSEFFIEKYCQIFDRKRKYYVGPGNENSRTDYGIYTTAIDHETGKFITDKNIFDKLIGKCSVYNSERRASGASYTAQEFNALNDLNNLTINHRKLEEKEKRAIINAYINHKSKAISANKVHGIIEAAIGEKIESFSGARVNKEGKELFHTLETYRTMRNEMEKLGLNISSFDKDGLDSIASILTLNTEKEGIEDAVVESGLKISEDELDFFITFRKENGTLFSKWQSFSTKIMNELIPAMYVEPKEQMTLLMEMGFFKTNMELYKGLTRIPEEELLSQVYNPVVRRSVRISVQILNALVKKYGAPAEIDIEMPRDKNEDDEKKRILDFQKKRETELRDIENRIYNEYGIRLTEADYRNHKGLALKLKLWAEQQGKSIYSGKYIPIDALIKNNNLFEVDHIIPRSISFDDSRNNKVLVYATENQIKGNRTPYKYIYMEGLDWEKYKATVKTIYVTKKKALTKKGELLLFTQDITKEEVRQGFIARNLNDTRYASKLVLGVISNYFRANDHPTKVKTVRGAFTHQLRTRLKLPKDRESFAHHAIDAALICYAQMGLNLYNEKRKAVIDIETGEIIDDSSKLLSDKEYEDCLFLNETHIIQQRINDAEKKIKYWRRVDKKSNRRICKETVRGTRERDGKQYKVYKMDIRDDDDVKNIFAKKINTAKEKDFLMASIDPKTFEILKEIYILYKDEENPFVAYEEETGEKIRKYSKKGRGCVISQLKYLNGELGSCIDISHKFGHEKNSGKVILEGRNPFRMDVYRNAETGKYILIGIKHSDCKYSNGKYEMNMDAYCAELAREGVINMHETLDDLCKHNIEFVMSFYKDEIIEYEKNGEIYRERFLARIQPNQKNRIETKPIERQKWPDAWPGTSNNRKQISLSKTSAIRKIRTDILGNQYLCEKEVFKTSI